MTADMSACCAGFAELHCLSNFTFLRGASHAEELIARAKVLGYSAIAITDECSVSGVVRAHAAAKEHGLKLIIGSEFLLDDTLKLVVLAPDRAGYARLCRLITTARRAADKGDYCVRRDALDDLDGCLVIWLSADTEPDDGCWLKKCFSGCLWIGVELLADGNDKRRLHKLERLGTELNIPLVACGDVHMHVRGRRALQDTLTAIRIRQPVHTAGLALYPNGERHLRNISRLEKLYPRAMLDETLRIADNCTFSLDELRYEYPREVVPDGLAAPDYLRHLTEQGMNERWPGKVPYRVRKLVESELTLISELNYEPYFLTVYDIVRFARSRGILCQGRGSAANSAVCFALGITSVDPSRMSMLFERFISKERDEPPDIDVDFEHERREEVIQYIYKKYGRDRAALAATVICYRPRSAMRDVGKALGLDELQVDRLARAMQWWDGATVLDERMSEAGFDPHSPLIRRLLTLVRMLIGFPRHLSQHVGGFVIARDDLCELVPVENAAMDDRTVIQWDKDDLEELGLLKVDVLGLGMLSAIRKSFDLIREFRGRELNLATVPAEDPAVYDMICLGDTTGVFQIESRAQMSMLPRLKPRNYYDLVVEVAIIRPGPIQGNMVHPYLRRRNGEERVTYPNDAVKEVLERTLGVPIFQEQVMQLAIVAAGFTPSEADSLRRAMAAWKRKGGLGPFRERLISGMRERGYPEEFAEQIYQQILGFGEYGFPESHAASFALLVYVSAWLKHYEPAVFFCALINSQPMGFYAPAQLTQVARRQGVEHRNVDVLYSDWDCTLERRDDGEPALRLGLRLVKHLSRNAADILIQMRSEKEFTSVQDLSERAKLNRRDMGALAAAGALKSLAGNRHRACWNVAGVETPTPLMSQIVINEATPMLTKPAEGQDIAADYRSIGLTLGRHPLALLRERMNNAHVRTAAELWQLENDMVITTAGLVVTRQRPGSASGVTFVTLEDETGQVNLIVWKSIAEQQRRVLVGARLMGVTGLIQREGDVLHVIARRLYDHSQWLGDLVTRSRDFH